MSRLSDVNFHLQKSEVPLVILDFRTFIYKHLKKVLASPTPLELCQWVLLNSPFTIHNSISQARVVVSDDTRDARGNYWRDNWIEQNCEPGFPRYKGTRKPKDEDYLVVINYFYEAVETLNLPFFSSDGFESDDIITMFRSVKEVYNDKRHTFFISVDYDLLQIVQSDINFHYYCTVPQKHLSQLKRSCDVEQMLVERKWGDGSIESFIAHKCTKGDRSDNLPKNTPRALVDLINPPVQPTHLIPKIYEEIKNFTPNTSRRACVELEANLYT